MHLPKKYLHDRLILLLLSVNLFLAAVNAISVLLRLDSPSGSYIVQYRANLGLSAFQAGNNTTLFGFALFGVFVFVFSLILSIQAYKFSKSYSFVILALSSFLLILSIIVGNALLVLR